MSHIFREIKVARGILIRGGSILLVRDLRPGQGHYFLPGGSIEAGESAKTALAREWEEDLGWIIEIEDFNGCVENKWDYKRKDDGLTVDVYEMNYVFTVNGEREIIMQKPISKEAHLEFSWVPVSDLHTTNLLPAALKDLIPSMVTLRPIGFWASNL